VTDEFRQVGDRVLVGGRLEARGRGSGITVDAPFWMLVDFREGKLSRTRAYLDEAEALKAVRATE
jgi:hypothetical protein